MSQIINVEDLPTPQRLDRFLKQRYPHIGFSVVQKWLRTGQMRINGKRAEGATDIKQGDQLRFPPQAQLEGSLSSHKIIPIVNSNTLKILKNNIILETPDFLALNKPFGLSTQGGTDVRDALSFYLNALNSDTSTPLRIIHRLDRDTSGIMLLAKSLAASQALSDIIAARLFDKYYLAIIVGQPRHRTGIIDLPIGKMTGILKEKMSSQAQNAVAAQTAYQVIDHNKGLTLICFKPITGRTHQIRVHSIEGLKCPILGDGKYGGKAAHPFDARGNMHLHAWSINFNAFDQRFSITAPLSTHFAKTLSQYHFDMPDLKVIMRSDTFIGK